MTMTNDENAAPLSVNVNISPVLGKSTDALSDPKNSLRRGTKRTRDTIEEKRVDEQEVKPCAPVSKKAKIEAWWRDAASTLANARSSVSESTVAKHTVAKMNQVGGALRILPTWLQSRGNAAKAFLKAAVSREGEAKASEGTKVADSATPLDSGVAVASNSSALLEHFGATYVDSSVSQDMAHVSVEEVVSTPTINDSTTDPVELQSELSHAVDPIDDCPLTEATILDNENLDIDSANSEVEEVALEVMEEGLLQPEPANEDPYAGAGNSFLSDEALAMSDEVQAFEQDVVEGGSDQAFDYDPTLANEANQADDVDYIVDSQGVEWYPVHDNATGFVYYWNQRTGETTWHRPVTSAEAAFGA
jgi:hypothetical protein